MKISIRKDLNIATVRSESLWNKFKIHTLLQNGERKQPSINAYLATKYSKSSDSILDIASEVLTQNIHFIENLEKVITKYGYGSIANMAELFICMEGVPILTAMKIFYTNSVISGQERSTRYLNLNNPEFTKIPREVCDNTDVRKEYERIMLKQLADYKDMLKPTREALARYFSINLDSLQESSVLKSRAYDVTKYLLPVGLNTNVAYLMSAKSWSDEISYLLASDSVVDNEIADLLSNLLGEGQLELKGYIKEADGLIKYIDANCNRKNSAEEVINYLKKYISTDQIKDIPESEVESVSVSYSPDCTETLISHYECLINPLGSANEFEFADEDQENISEILFARHDQNSTIGNIGQSGAIKITGFASLGVLQNITRQSSLEKFIPLLHDNVDLGQELDRRDYQYFYLCDYLNVSSMNKLKKEYQKRLEETYVRIKAWRKYANDFMSKDLVDEFTKYLLPYAHATKYIVYGSFDDLQSLINSGLRNKEAITYRMLVHEWLRLLALKDPIWKSLLKKVIIPRVDDKVQFIDRS